MKKYMQQQIIRLQKTLTRNSWSISLLKVYPYWQASGYNNDNNNIKNK